MTLKSIRVIVATSYLRNDERYGQGSYWAL